MRPTEGGRKNGNASINSAAAHQPKSGAKPPAGFRSGSAVGNETSADMAGAFGENPNRGTSGSLGKLKSSGPAMRRSELGDK